MWKYTSRQIIPGESWYDDLRDMGKLGWEAWHIEKSESGHREIYYKRFDDAADSNSAPKETT